MKVLANGRRVWVFGPFFDTKYFAVCTCFGAPMWGVFLGEAHALLAPFPGLCVLLFWGDPPP